MCVCVCTDELTPQQLFNLSAGLRGGELVNDVQRGLTHGVSHACTDAALDERGQNRSLSAMRILE